MTIIKIKAEIKPTEDPKKVMTAISNLFGNVELNYDPSQGIIMSEITDNQLSAFRRNISRDRIRTTLNNTLCRWINEDYLSFGLNRQAAYAGHVSLNLTNEDPMGPIQIQIKGDVQGVINFICS
jgi:predicted RNA binding protein with dsRBD fold (UPF0201 family)